MFQSARAEYYRLKKPCPVKKFKATTVQDVLEILRIAPNGIMEVSKNQYAKSYFLHTKNIIHK